MFRVPRAANVLSLASQRTSLPLRRLPVALAFSTRHAQDDHQSTSTHTVARTVDGADDTRFTVHLNSLFPSLEFPPELARRILTHGSHRAAIHGHNGRLSFIGRRVLESYFLLFVHEVAQARAHHDYDRLTSRALNTYFLGEHVAPQWSLGRALLWVPTVPKETLRTAQSRNSDSELDEALRASPGAAKSVGLYKVMGEAVQAVVGGVYHQFGGSVAHQLFHTRILPHLLLPGSSSGVPEEFHAFALRVCEQMGGPESDLARPFNGLLPTEDRHVRVETKRRVAAAGL